MDVPLRRVAVAVHRPIVPPPPPPPAEVEAEAEAEAEAEVAPVNPEPIQSHRLRNMTQSTTRTGRRGRLGVKLPAKKQESRRIRELIRIRWSVLAVWFLALRVTAVDCFYPCSGT